MITRNMLVAIAILLLLGGVMIRADMYPPVELELDGGLRPATPGLLFTGDLVLTSADSCQITILSLEAEGWSGFDYLSADSATLGPGDSMMIAISGTPGDSSEFITVTYDFYYFDSLTSDSNFQVSSQVSINLSPWAYEDSVYPHQAMTLNYVDTGFFDASGLTIIPPDPADTVGRVSPIPDDEEEQGDIEYEIRVHGRICYMDGTRTIGADGVKITVYDDDPKPNKDDKLAEVHTDASGFFDVIVHSTDEGGPELKLVGELRNAAARKRNSSWVTPIMRDYTEDDLNWGNVFPESERDYALFHIHTILSRCWRWVRNNLGYELAKVRFYFDAGKSSQYISWKDPSEIYIGGGDGWNEGVIAHEYGHHVDDCFGHIPTYPDYCNDMCDGGVGCGHCMWCREASTVAWNEGWAQYFASVMTRSFGPDYGDAADFPREMEYIGGCSRDGGAIHNAGNVEGAVACLLRDIEDSDNENDLLMPGWSDQLALGTGVVFSLAVVDRDPRKISSFINGFKADYPQHKEALWETAMNNGFWDLDEVRPQLVTNLTSTSHDVGVANPNPVVDLTWTQALDDFSGISDYSVIMSPGDPAEPGISPDDFIGKRTTYTYPPYPGMLDPGEYYFCIKTYDIAGNPSDGYASYGPIIIDEPGPMDVAMVDRSGWTYRVVPRSTADATPESCPLPSSLPGGANVYFNLSGQNVGSQVIDYALCNEVYVDGEKVLEAELDAVAEPIFIPDPFVHLNLNGGTVRGGLHSIVGKLNCNNGHGESSVADDYWGRQFAWTGQDITFATATRSAPPPSTGGHTFLAGTPYPNSDGFTLGTGTYWWDAVVVVAMSNNDDYNCRLHYHSTDPSSAFTSYLKSSERPAGCVEALIANWNVMGTQDYDVGVINDNCSDCNDFIIKHIGSVAMAFGPEVSVTMEEGDYLILRHFEVPAGIGRVTITVNVPPDLPRIAIRAFNKDFSTGALSDPGTIRYTTPAGRADLEIDIPGPGSYCLAIYRDPVIWGSPSEGGSPRAAAVDPVEMTIHAREKPADFQPICPEFWDSPLLPTEYPEGPDTVFLPEMLAGDTVCYLNFALIDIDTNMQWSSVTVQTDLDGEKLWHSTLPRIGDSLIVKHNSPIEDAVTGGRHTLSARYDIFDSIPELYEDNNIYSEQFVWMPVDLPPGTAVYRTTAPPAVGGWTGITSDEPFRYNSDGLRTPAFAPDGEDGWWAGLAVMPPDLTENVDLRLHETATSSKDGFSTPLTSSHWGAGQLDYVLVNFNNANFRDFDIGIMAGDTTTSYAAQVVTSGFHPFVDSSWSTADTLEFAELLDLHEAWYDTGYYVVELTNAGGSVDWGIAFHPANLAYMSRTTVLNDQAAWFNAAGEAESLAVDITEAGYYAIAVFKHSLLSFHLTGFYELTVTRTERPTSCCIGITGNVDGDTEELVDIGDLTALISYLYIPPNPAPPCMEEANIDGDTEGVVDIGDLTGLISYLYIPPNPSPANCP